MVAWWWTEFHNSIKQKTAAAVTSQKYSERKLKSAVTETRWIARQETRLLISRTLRVRQRTRECPKTWWGRRLRTTHEYLFWRSRWLKRRMKFFSPKRPPIKIVERKESHKLTGFHCLPPSHGIRHSLRLIIRSVALCQRTILISLERPAARTDIRLVAATAKETYPKGRFHLGWISLQLRKSTSLETAASGLPLAKSSRSKFPTLRSSTPTKRWAGLLKT